MNLRPYYHMAIVLTITALLGVFSATRLSQRGQWLPEVPSEIGTWTGVDIPLESARVGELGNPQTLGRVYANPFDEKVTAEVIATQTFDAYTEPNMSKSGYGFTLTAQLFPEVFGKGNAARAMVLKHEESGVRVLMLYWVQYEDGTTSGMGSTSGYADMGRRFQTGVGTVASGKQAVIVRVYTQMLPSDNSGAQARRNLYDIGRGLYEGIKKDGMIWRNRDKKLVLTEGTNGNAS